MSDNVRNIVDLALDDKPNKAGDVLNDVLVDKLADKVQGIKSTVSNGMFGQEFDPDAEPVEVQPELDLEPNDDGDEYQADQELIDEPDDLETDEDEGEETEIEPETDLEQEQEEE